MSAVSTHYGDPDDLTQQEADATHPGFVVQCGACESTLVYVETSLGFSSTSGSWGSVDLTCFSCKATATLVEPG